MNRQGWILLCVLFVSALLACSPATTPPTENNKEKTVAEKSKETVATDASEPKDTKEPASEPTQEPAPELVKEPVQEPTTPDEPAVKEETPREQGDGGTSEPVAEKDGGSGEVIPETVQDQIPEKPPVHTPSQIVDRTGGFILSKGMMTKKWYEITWPGTHNSQANNRERGTKIKYRYNIKAKDYIKSQFGLDLIARINDVNSVIKGFNKTVGKVGLGKIKEIDKKDLKTDVSTLNQDLSIAQQLAGGIRFFTLDLLQNETNSETFFAHGNTDLGKATMQPTLEDVRKYLQANPGVILILSLDLVENKKVAVSKLVGEVDKAFKDLKDEIKDFGKNLANPTKYKKIYKEIKDLLTTISRLLPRLEKEMNEMLANSDPNDTNKLKMLRDFYNAAVKAGLWKYVEKGSSINPTGKTNVSQFKFQDTWRSLNAMKADGKRVILLVDFLSTKYPSITGNYKFTKAGKDTNAATSWLDYNPAIAAIKQPSKKGVNLSSFTLYANPNPGAYGSADKAAVQPLNDALPLYLSGKKVVAELQKNFATWNAYFTYYQVQFFEPGVFQPTMTRRGMTVIEAANRINYEKFNLKWEVSYARELYWNNGNLYPLIARKVLKRNDLKSTALTAYKAANWGGKDQANAISQNPFAFWTSGSKTGSGTWEYAVMVKHGSNAATGAVMLAASNVATVGIFGSTDGTKWVQLKSTGYASAPGKLWKVFGVTNSKAYRYTKVEIKRSNPKAAARIFDLRVLVK